MIKLGFASMLALSMLTFSACDGDDDGGDGDGTGGADAAPGGGADAGPTTDAGPNDWQVLMQGDWSMEPGVDQFKCIVTTLDRDISIKAFKPMIPTGTHHTVLTIYSGNRADGMHDCGSNENGQRMIYGSGVGSPEFAFPAGVGLKLTKGTRLLNNIHLFNAGESTITGTSGAFFMEASASEIMHEAEIVLAGPLQINIQAKAPANFTASGTCSISNLTNEPIHVFSISQHMHMAGRHLKSELIRGGQTTMLQDVDYDFESQGFTALDQHIELLPGDKLKTTCTYEFGDWHPNWNGGDGTINWGDNSTDEMCFTDIFYYPAQGANFICPF